MGTTLKLTRNQLAAFLKDFESIKQFEKLFAITDEISTSVIGDLVVSIEVASAQAIQALDELSDIQADVQRLIVESNKDLSEEHAVEQPLLSETTLSELSDVRINLPANGESLKYNAALRIWTNAP